MTGAENYAEAERLIESACDHFYDGAGEVANHQLQAAQVHATLALAAATSNPLGETFGRLS